MFNMACLHPIWIINKHYSTIYKGIVGNEAVKRRFTYKELMANPWDVARQYVCVPCGKCEECLRAERSSWFCRLDRELAFCRRFNMPSWFVTLTVKPEMYDLAVSSPSQFMRKFFEKIRHRFGKSIKHFFIQEVGKDGRLHFHGLFFGPRIRYSDLHEVADGFGFAWVAPTTARRCRYVVKYILKDLGDFPPSFRDKKYRRKFVSAHVGEFFGTKQQPSAVTKMWRYTDGKTGITYKYKIPRYYDKFLSDREIIKKSVIGAYLMAPLTIPLHSVSFQQTLESLSGTVLPKFELPAVQSFLEKFNIKKSFQKWHQHRKLATTLTDTLDTIFRKVWLSLLPPALFTPARCGSSTRATSLQFKLAL